MKRIPALFLSAALLLALLGACTGSNDPITTVIPSDSAGESATVPPADTTQEPSLDLPSEEPSEEISAEPSEAPSQTPTTQAPATQAPTHHPEESHHVEPTHHPDPTPSPTVPGGGIIMPGGGGSAQEPTDAPSEDPNGFTEPTGPSASDVNLTNFHQTIMNSYTFPDSMRVQSTDYIANMFPGLASIPVVQRVVAIPEISNTAAELVLVQVTDISDVNAVKAILQARVDRQIDINRTYPLTADAYQNNSRIVSKGNYVMLVVHSECDAIANQFNALF